MAKRRKKTALAAWIEASIVLSDTVAERGPVGLWPWQRAIADAMTAPTERVTMM